MMLQWERALAVAPGVSIQYWKSLAVRSEHIDGFFLTESLLQFHCPFAYIFMCCVNPWRNTDSTDKVSVLQMVVLNQTV